MTFSNEFAPIFSKMVENPGLSNRAVAELLGHVSSGTPNKNGFEKLCRITRRMVSPPWGDELRAFIVKVQKREFSKEFRFMYHPTGCDRYSSTCSQTSSLFSQIRQALCYKSA